MLHELAVRLANAVSFFLHRFRKDAADASCDEGVPESVVTLLVQPTQLELSFSGATEALKPTVTILTLPDLSCYQRPATRQPTRAKEKRAWFQVLPEERLDVKNPWGFDGSTMAILHERLINRSGVEVTFKEICDPKGSLARGRNRISAIFGVAVRQIRETTGDLDTSAYPDEVVAKIYRAIQDLRGSRVVVRAKAAPPQPKEEPTAPPKLPTAADEGIVELPEQVSQDTGPDSIPFVTLPRSVLNRLGERGLTPEEELEEGHEIGSDDGRRLHRARKAMEREAAEDGSAWTVPATSIPARSSRFRLRDGVKLPNYHHPWTNPKTGRLQPMDLYLLWQRYAARKDSREIASSSYEGDTEAAAKWIDAQTKWGMSVILNTEFSDAEYPGTATILRRAVLMIAGGDGRKTYQEPPLEKHQPKDGAAADQNESSTCPKCGGSLLFEEDWHGTSDSCLQCGYVIERGRTALEELADPDKRRRRPSHGKLKL